MRTSAASPHFAGSSYARIVANGFRGDSFKVHPSSDGWHDMAWGNAEGALERDGCFGSPARLAVLGGCDVSAPQDPFRYRPHPSAYAGAKERRAKRRPAKIILVSGGIPCGCGCGEITNVVTRTERARGRIAGAPYRFVSGHNLRLLRGAA